MYARILKFLTNLLFKRVFRGFLTPRKKRKPGRIATCCYCFRSFPAFNKRQHVCGVYWCKRLHRTKQYRTRIEFAASQRKAEMEATQARDRHTAAVIIGPTGEEEEE